MNTLNRKLYFSILIVLLIACNRDKQIIQLLNSVKSRDIIIGAYKAGETGDKKFVPLLLRNANDPRSTTYIKFKGFTVCQEKMVALRKIFKTEPPVVITRNPDSTVKKFYNDLSKRDK